MPYEGNRTGGDVPLAELGSAGKTPAGKGRHHALDRHSDHIDSAFARLPADVAIQQRLGAITLRAVWGSSSSSSSWSFCCAEQDDKLRSPAKNRV
jgi:hypothetical protein